MIPDGWLVVAGVYCGTVPIALWKWTTWLATHPVATRMHVLMAQVWWVFIIIGAPGFAWGIPFGGWEADDAANAIGGE